MQSVVIGTLVASQIRPKSAMIGRQRSEGCFIEVKVVVSFERWKFTGLCVRWEQNWLVDTDN